MAKVCDGGNGNMRTQFQFVPQSGATTAANAKLEKNKDTNNATGNDILVSGRPFGWCYKTKLGRAEGGRRKVEGNPTRIDRCITVIGVF